MKGIIHDKPTELYPGVWLTQPGLKNLTDHFLEEWYWRPAAIASYSTGRLCGTRSSYAWHNTLSEMGMVVISSTLTVGPIAETLDEPVKAAPRSYMGVRRSAPFSCERGAPATLVLHLDKLGTKIREADAFLLAGEYNWGMPLPLKFLRLAFISIEMTLSLNSLRRMRG